MFERLRGSNTRNLNYLPLDFDPLSRSNIKREKERKRNLVISRWLASLKGREGVSFVSPNIKSVLVGLIYYTVHYAALCSPL